ncbi:MAG: AAA family ATPase [Pseudonocardiales bacterium]
MPQTGEIVLIHSVRRDPLAAPYDPAQWPFTMPPIKKILTEGLRFSRPVTFLIGENGSGKSTVLAAIAEAQGVDARGGSVGRRYAPAAPKSELARQLAIELTAHGTRTIGRKARGYFLRAETAYGYFQFVERQHVAGFGDRSLLEQSHGESFWQLFEHKFSHPGLYLMDEPESALSFSSCLRLIGLIQSLAATGSQIICATHSPLLTAFPQAHLIEVGDHGLRTLEWAELELVDHWRRYLTTPDAYLRHIIDT